MQSLGGRHSAAGAWRRTIVKDSRVTGDGMPDVLPRWTSIVSGCSRSDSSPGAGRHGTAEIRGNRARRGRARFSRRARLAALGASRARVVVG